MSGCILHCEFLQGIDELVSLVGTFWIAVPHLQAVTFTSTCNETICIVCIQAEAAAVVKTACLVNLANCAHKDQQYGEALDWCNKALRCEMLAIMMTECTVTDANLVEWNQSQSVAAVLRRPARASGTEQQVKIQSMHASVMH